MAEMTIRDILTDDKLVKRVPDANGNKVYETLDTCLVLVCEPDDIQVDKYTRVDILVDHDTYVDVCSRAVGEPLSPETTLVVLR